MSMIQQQTFQLVLFQQPIVFSMLCCECGAIPYT